MLGVAVTISLAYSAWSVGTIDRELRTSYQSITGALDGLEFIKRRFERQTQAVREIIGQSGAPLPESAVSVAEQEFGVGPAPIVLTLDPSEMADRLDALNANPIFGRLIGARRSINERTRSLTSRMTDLRIAWETNDRDDFEASASDALPIWEELHSLIEQLQERLIDDLDASLTSAAEIRDTLHGLLLGCFTAALLTGLLAFLLIRRWMLRPIAELRRATLELQSGNLDYRIPVRSRDELGALSAEVNQLAATIVETQSRLVERERLAATGEMMRRIVHNLRNPLAGIRSLAELTRAELPVDSDVRENQQRILATVDRFERWLSEVLQSTAPLEVKPEADEPTPFLISTLEPHQAAAEGRGIALEFRDHGLPQSARFDRRHLQHAVTALVANAIDAAPDGGVVRVIGTSTSENGEAGGPGWSIRVEDSGAGVDESLRERIFEPYFTTKRHGTGIGLAVVRNLVQAHGGSVRVDRSELGGAAFIITLPE